MNEEKNKSDETRGPGKDAACGSPDEQPRPASYGDGDFDHAGIGGDLL